MSRWRGCRPLGLNIRNVVRSQVSTAMTKAAKQAWVDERGATGSKQGQLAAG